MQNAIPTLGTISWCRRLLPATAALGLLLVFGFAQTGLAQTTNLLTPSNNYFVTGDYVVGGVGLRGLGDATGFAKGTIAIPDLMQPNSAAVPTGADIVAAYLYWETVESSQSVMAGQNGFFNGYAITGAILGNPNAPTSWSTGGCSGSSNGSKTMRAYRADVRPFLPLDANGNVQGNGSYQVRLADSGSNGGGTPLTLGATLVIIYRVLSSAVPLNSIVLYDGAVTPSNASSTMSQQIAGFYQAAASPVAKITHIVGNGQSNKSESVFLNGVNLPSLYTNLPPFPGLYNGSWDNPTWPVNSVVRANDASETTSVVPAPTNSSCVSWGAVIFSSTVQSSDGDGLLDTWKSSQGYTDLISGQWVALPGAQRSRKDLFVEVDYLSNLDGKAGSYLHSHLPKQAAIDMVGKAFQNAPVDCDPITLACKGVTVHFDLGPGIYQSDPYVIAYPVLLPNPLPPGTTAPPAGAGGNAISESTALCTDAKGTPLCAFPNQPTVGWKDGFLFFKNTSTLGNFQAGRKDSYHYLLFGHGLGVARSYWSTANTALIGFGLGSLDSIVVSGNLTTVTIESPSGFLKPGDPVNPGDPAFGDFNLDRVSVEGAIQNAALNGTYLYTFKSQSTDSKTNITTTVFTIPTPPGVATGIYKASNEPQLALTYAGPTSTSGHSDLGGADSAVTFGLWAADDVPGCIANPSAIQPGQSYCDNQVGNVQAQAGTLMHEIGHTFTLTHGGMYFSTTNNAPPVAPTYDLNCKPNFLSVMNYLFQIRGFPDGGIDYSGQTLPDLNETTLSEASGINLGLATPHFTRWYAPPNALDLKLGTSRIAQAHCDGSPIGPNEKMVRVNGTSSTQVDWNNDLFVPDAVSPQDVNFNGSVDAAPFRGFSDWAAFDLRQIGARWSVDGFSGGGSVHTVGGGSVHTVGGGSPLDPASGSVATVGGGSVHTVGGGSVAIVGGGTDQDFDTASSTMDPPSGLQCSNCVLSSGSLLSNGKTVSLAWTSPTFGQVRTYSVWRAVGSFTMLQSIVANAASFSNVGTVTGTPPSPSFNDTTVKNGVTYTYFVTDSNKRGVQSAASSSVTLTVKF